MNNANDERAKVDKMSFFSRNSKQVDSPTPQQLHDIKSRQILEGIKASIAFIEFTPKGEIIDANDNFLNVIGYSLDEIKGQHHRIFCDEAYTKSGDYSSFWGKLASGKSLSDRFLRFTRANAPIWLEATYNPITDDTGRVLSVVKIATDVTEHVNKANIQEGILKALDRSMATISFNLDGTIIDANENFLNTVGYRIEDVKGKSHSIFCQDDYVHSSEYSQFWDTLNRGEYIHGLFERKTARGEAIWLEASYNPVVDQSGNLIRIVKFATDVTTRITSVMNASASVQATVMQTEVVSTQAKSLLKDSVGIMDEIVENVNVLFNNIGELGSQSSQISDIVSTISSIADQTNLLALNAAIEAARAGEQGRGFAVVADEVRQLAARTSKSTTEITNVVKDNQAISQALSESIMATQEKANLGTELITQVDDVFREINQGMSEVSSAVEQLS